MEVIDRLCPACRKMFSRETVELTVLLGSGLARYEHHSQPYILEEASLAGCYICRKIWTQLSWAEQDLIRSTRWWLAWVARQKWWISWLARQEWLFAGFGYVPPRGVYSWQPEEGFSRLRFVFGPGFSGWRTICFDLYPADGPVDLQSYRLAGPQALSLREQLNTTEIGSSTESDQTWSTITNWWDESMRRNKNRTSMRNWTSLTQMDDRLSQSAQLPTRLLDLHNTSLHDDLSLSITGENEGEYTYVTLSYRWIDDRYRPSNGHWPWELTSQSLSKMCNGIPFADLPKTFQDAIVVTRRLNIRYLWIDSMCILQDDDLDWKLESGKMGRIYEHAVCNIAAGVGTAKTGLFVRRIPKDLMPLEVNVRRWEDRPDVTSQYLIEHGYLKHHLSQASLNSRGWVFQERTLSKQILHFSSYQVFWQEHGYDACELFPRGCPMSKNSFNDSVRPTDEIIRDDLLNPETWDQVIRGFSATSLTRSGDRMIALAALAQHWLRLLGEDGYCAGLLQSMLPLCLLWKVTDGRDCEADQEQHRAIHKLGEPRLSYRSAEFHAPSWSWLSVKGRVDPYSVFDIFRERDSRARISECHLPPKDPSLELGPLSIGAYIVICARLKSAEGMYWPMSSLYESINSLDRSIIHARTSPFSIRVVCSIDDMASFLQRWKSAVPSKEGLAARMRLFSYNAASYAIAIGFVMSFIYSLGRLVWLGVLLLWIGFLIRSCVLHFTHFGSDGIYFLEIYTHHDMESKGLVIQKQSDGRYHRLGVFTVKHGGFFTHVAEERVVLV